MPTAAPEPITRRRWPTPPPLTGGDESPLSGFVVLQEFPEDSGILLWESLEGVRLWAGATPEERELLFLPAAAAKRRDALRIFPLGAELRDPLGVLARVLDGSTQAETLAEACRAVVGWADARDKLGTALAFMEAAALAHPSDARAAYDTGRLARRRAEYARAESWFYEAISRALQGRDWDTYARGFIGLGNQHIQRGNYPMGKRCHTRALRIARKRELREVEAMALHELFVVAMEKEEASEAEALAIGAFRLYGAGHPLLPNLVHDLGCLWMDHGKFAHALPLLQAVLPYQHDRRVRLLTLGVIAEACGKLGRSEEYRATWEQLWAAVDEVNTVEGCAQALVGLAVGAVSLGEWRRAERAAARALSFAEQRRESRALLRAEALLEQVEAACAAPARTPRRPLDQSPDPKNDAVVAEMVAAFT